MAIIAAERSRRRLIFGLSAVGAAAAVLFGALGSCAPAGTAPPPSPQPLPSPSPSPSPAEPVLRIGLAVGAAAASIGGAEELAVTDPAGSRIAEVPPGEVWRVVAARNGLALLGPGGTLLAEAEALSVTAATVEEPVRVNARGYHGSLSFLRDRTGLTVVNRVPLEAYLLGVVSAEMGRRSGPEHEALRAQAVVSRSFALRNLRRWNADGFDLSATVADQVYGGIGAETPEGLDAVQGTRGEILSYGGAPIDAFFYSTCGGRTADGSEVFRAAARPYLRSVSDLADDGVAYCSISPRFRWHEEWSGENLRATLARTLPSVAAIPADRIREVDDVRVSYRTPSGRVGELAITLPGREVRVDGPAVRRVLQPSSGGMLRSSAFTLSVTGAGRRVTRLQADGAGAGHGVGFCQWGAVGRARAGQDYRRILSTYYPGATLTRLYR